MGEACVALEDGKIFKGVSFGASGEALGEVVFNTSMVGYQEIISDPSYAGQIITMTYPLIGNYGVTSEDMESRRSFAEGFVVREASRMYSNWRAEGSLGKLLKEQGIVAVEGVDTRALTKHIRSVGAMKGIISTVDLDKESLVKKAKASPGLIKRDLVKGVTVDKAYKRRTEKKAQFKVVALDYGMKQNILAELLKVGVDVQVVPANASAEEILKYSPDGVFLSNGPGDPEGVPYAISVVKKLIGAKPIFGICLGHQILALALGGKTYKLKFGHRGGNQPVKNLLTGRVEITAQNHGFAVDFESLKVKVRPWQVGKTIELGGWKGESEFGPIEITHINLNDGTVEGLRCEAVSAFSVQYHPEATPGPHDSKYLFDDFISLMEEQR